MRRRPSVQGTCLCITTGRSTILPTNQPDLVDFDRPLHLSDGWHLSLYPNLGVATQLPQLPHDRSAEEAPQSSVLSGWLVLGVASTRARLPLDQDDEAAEPLPSLVCLPGWSWRCNTALSSATRSWGPTCLCITNGSSLNLSMKSTMDTTVFRIFGSWHLSLPGISILRSRYGLCGTCTVFVWMVGPWCCNTTGRSTTMSLTGAVGNSQSFGPPKHKLLSGTHLCIYVLTTELHLEYLNPPSGSSV